MALDARGRLLGRLALDLVENAAEVADRPHVVARRPRLAREQVAHVAVGVERLDVAAGDRVLVVVPAELGRAPVRPHLESLRLHGHRVVDAGREALVVLDQLLADRLQRADRDSEHHLVEVPVLAGARARERLRARLERVGDELELVALGAWLELVPERRARPALESLDSLERVVFGEAGRELRLLDQLDPVDAAERATALVLAEPQGGDGVEELELDAAGAQGLVERREDRVAHARLHLVHDRTAVAEGEPQQIAGCGPGRHVGGGDRAARVAERDVIDGAQHGRALLGRAPDRDLLGAVAGEPGRPLLVVDRLEAMLQHAVLDDARKRRHARVDGGEEETQARLVGAAGPDHEPEPVAEALQQPHEERGLNRLERQPVIGRAGARAGEPFGHAEQPLGAVDRQFEQIRRKLPGEVLEPVGHERDVHVVELDEPRLPQHAPALQREAAGLGDDLPEGGQLAAVAGAQEVARAVEGMAVPAVALAVVEDQPVAGLERVVEARERGAGLAAQLRVGVAHQPEGVVVEAEPDMQPVLLDPVRASRVAAARPLAAEPPSELVDGDRVARAQLRGRCQLESRGEAADAAAQDGYLFSCLAAVHAPVPVPFEVFAILSR